MSEIDWRAVAIAKGRNPDAYVALICDECGWLHVVSIAKSEQHIAERPASFGAQPGHHVVPGDDVNDWICYGHPVEVPIQAVIDAHVTRSVFGVAGMQPTPAQLANLAAKTRPQRRTAIANAIATAVANAGG